MAVRCSTSIFYSLSFTKSYNSYFPHVCMQQIILFTGSLPALFSGDIWGSLNWEGEGAPQKCCSHFCEGITLLSSHSHWLGPPWQWCGDECLACPASSKTHFQLHGPLWLQFWLCTLCILPFHFVWMLRSIWNYFLTIETTTKNISSNFSFYARDEDELLGQVT